MNENKHTPGPWSPLKVEDYYQINAQPKFLRGFSNHIANVEGEENAYLIAAAPIMLEALTECPILSKYNKAEDFISDFEKWRDKYAIPACRKATNK